ncbi:MAG: hypothetical protein ACHQ4J_15070 [Candidatus Binatia bacterium]
MINLKRRSGSLGRVALMSVSVAVLAGSAFGIQTPQKLPATHERQCVPTGEIAPGDARTITVTWNQPFATGAYDIIGSVSEPGDNLQAIELAHVVIPSTPTTAAAVVLNRNTNAPQSGILCLDASAE